MLLNDTHSGIFRLFYLMLVKFHSIKPPIDIRKKEPGNG